MRIVIAEDAVLLRDGLSRLLTDKRHEVVATVADADTLLDAVPNTYRTWRSSISDCRRHSPTKGCAQRK